MSPRCRVLGCVGKGPNGEKLKRYRFPRDKELRRRWCYLCQCQLKLGEADRVCERHFSRQQRLVDSDIPIKLGKRVLKPEAVPDLHLPDFPPEIPGIFEIPETPEEVPELPKIPEEVPELPKIPEEVPELPKIPVEVPELPQIPVESNIKNMSPSFKKCVPLSVKVKILDDQEKGYGPKKIMKKYKVKKSTYYRILSEKEMIRDYVDRGGSLNFTPKLEKTNDEPEADEAFESTDHKDKVRETKSEGDVKVNCDKAAMDWYSEQQAEGVPVAEADINGAAERLARELGFTHFKLNSGWPLRFRKPQSTVDSSLNSAENSDEDDKDSVHSENSGMRGMKILRIQDQITAFQRLQAGETAGQIASDLGVSRQTIQRVKKRLKDTLFTPTTDQKYHISVESMKTKFKSENNAVKGNAETDKNKEAMLAAIEHRKQLKLNNMEIPRKDKSLTDVEQIEAVAQCKAGVPLKTIAINFGVSPSTIQRVKKKFSESHQLHYKNYMRLDQKVRVLERLDEGESILEIAQDLGVHDTTIRGIKKSRLKIMSLYRSGYRSAHAAARATSKIVKYDKMESKLLAWINNLQRWKIPMSASMIQKKALMIQMHIAQEDGSSSSQSFLPTKEWLSDFKRRNNIKKFSEEDTDSENEDEIMFTKAAPKSKKKFYTAKRKGDADTDATASQDKPQPHTVNMSLSKFAEGLREMYLTRSLPENPYRCNSFTPRVILSSVDPGLVEKCISIDIVKAEPPSDEETWLTAHTNVGSDSDWTEQNWDANSLPEVSSRGRESPRRKRRNSNNEFSRKRRRVAEDESDGDGSDADFDSNSYLNVSIKQEPESTVDSISPNVPMAVLPAGSTYVPPLPMFQMPTSGLTMFMPESQHQQMMMQHPINYPHNNTSDMFMNQQQLKGRTIDSSASDQFNDIHDEASVEPSIRQENENVIMMPFGRDTDEQEKSEDLPSSEPDSVSDALAEKARKERAAAIAETIGINCEGPSHKKLRDLTIKLLELNNKNLLCDDRIDKAKEEYEKTVAQIQAEKRMNEMEIDKVLSAIQEWKEAKGNNTT